MKQITLKKYSCKHSAPMCMTYNFIVAKYSDYNS